MILKIDEINKRSIPYEEYFGIMDLSEKQLKARIDFAERLEEEIMTIFSLFDVLSDFSYADDTLIKNQLKQAYLDVSMSVGVVIDDNVDWLGLLFAMNFVDATRRHVERLKGNQVPDATENETMDKPSDAWFLSEDRAKYNAENEANTVLNYSDFQAAKNNYKFKTWITENDSRVRASHIPLEGETIPINEYFVVGDSLMRFPKDLEFSPSPEEIVNCRCSISYHN